MEPFRRPTAIPLDPGPSSAAVVVTDFVPKSFANEGPEDPISTGRGRARGSGASRALTGKDGLEHIKNLLLAAAGKARNLIEELAGATGGTAAPLRLGRESEK